jgi:hypothetical protein
MTSELSKPDRKNWQLHRRTHKDIYSLALVDSSKWAITSADSNLGKVLGKNQAHEFKFKMNPKGLDLEEPMAMVVKPTQGGQYIEHQGQIYKNITITGTTGLRPNKKAGAVSIIPGATHTTPDPKSGANPGERTGFDDLIDLRNLFRAYAMAKVDAELASSTLMIWKNGKEGEYFVVEPISFNTSRDSSSPLTANYTIKLRTIERWEGKQASLVEDSAINRGFSAFNPNKYIQILADSINTANALADKGLSVVARHITDIMRPTNELFSALAKLATTSRRIIEIPRHTVVTLESNVQIAISEVSSTILYADGTIDSAAMELLSSYRGIRRAVTSVLAQFDLWEAAPGDVLNTRKAQYLDRVLGNIDAGGDKTSLSTETASTGIGQAVVGAGDDIRKLSKRLLGSASRWKALVIANNLKSPYVSKDGDGIDVLRPGDYILYPTTSAPPVTAVGSTGGKSGALSPIEERLGRDVKLVSPKSLGGVTQFDFAVGDNGDIELVEGVENLKQAIRSKFETEQGELPLHPFFGISFPIGVKAPAATGFIEFDVNARATLLSDPRLASIEELDIEFVGNELDIKGTVAVIGFDGSLPFDFVTRR